MLVAISWSPALKQFSGSRALTVSSNKVAQLIDVARQNAITKQALTALIVLVEGSDVKFRTFTIAERGEDGIWRQITNWEPLAAGVSLEVDPRHCSFLGNPLPLPGYTSDQIAYCDRPLTPDEFAYVVFHPDGGIGSSNKIGQIRLVEGAMPDSEARTSRSEPPSRGTFFDIAFGGTTQVQKGRRP